MIDETLALTRQYDRVCPIGQKWKLFAETLQKQKPAAAPAFPPPYLGQAWWKTPDTEKAKRLEEQLRWADQHGLLPVAHQFLVSLRAGDWHRNVKSVRAAPSHREYSSNTESLGLLNELAFIRDEIQDIPGISEKPKGGVKSFCSRIGYALSLGLREKEIFVFGLLQWVAIGFGYLLWVQMLDWIPEDVWRSAAESRKGSIADWVLFIWSFVCVGLVSFPVGILSGCMGATHFLHKQGRESTVATCLKLVLPQSWPLWSFHWIDGWITVNQILERLPRDDDCRTPADRAASEALYYAWKLGISGVLPAIITGKNLYASGKGSIRFVKAKFIEVAKLRAGYSALCWIVGVFAYLATILLFMVVDIVPPGHEIYGHIYAFYLWAAVPILVSLSVIMLLLRPIYILSICDLYSEYLKERDLEVPLPENPPVAVSAFVAFGILCIVIASAYLYRDELGITDMLSTPYGQEYRPQPVQK